VERCCHGIDVRCFHVKPGWSPTEEIQDLLDEISRGRRDLGVEIVHSIGGRR
jgi:hypothetical protein